MKATIALRAWTGRDRSTALPMRYEGREAADSLSEQPLGGLASACLTPRGRSDGPGRMGTRPGFRAGSQGYIFVLLGSLFLFSTLVFAALGFVTGRVELPPASGPGVSEGTVSPGALVSGPFGQKLLYGHLKIQAVTGSGRSTRYRTLYDQSLGNPRVELSGASAPEVVELPAYSYERWKHVDTIYKSLTSLEGTGLESYVKGWQQVERKRFSVEFRAVHPGDVLVLDRRNAKAPKLWFGTRQTIEQREAAQASYARLLWGGAGGFLGMFGLVLLALHFVLGARIRRAMPPDHGPTSVPSWIALAARQKGGSYNGTFGNRGLSATCLYRKHGLGPLLLRIDTRLATRLSFTRRGGFGTGAGLLPSASTPAFDHPEYPGIELRGADPRWAEQALQHPTVRGAVLQLFDPAVNLSESVALELRPGAVTLLLGGIRNEEVTPDLAARWLEALQAFLDAVESLPAPAEALAPTRLEHVAGDQAARSRSLVIAMGLLVGIVVVATAVLLIAMG